jgi:hypothetical protein
MRKVIWRSIALQQVFYIVLGVFGYLSTLDRTIPVVLERESPKSLEFNWLMIIARIFMSLTLILAIPLQIHP